MLYVRFREIISACLSAAALYHPDTYSDIPLSNRTALESLFLRVAEAYSVLSDDTLRRRYDYALMQLGDLSYPADRDWTAVDQELGATQASSASTSKSRSRAAVVWTVQDAILLFQLLKMAVPRHVGSGAGRMTAVWSLVMIFMAVCPFVLRRVLRAQLSSLFHKPATRPLDSLVDMIESQAAPHASECSLPSRSAAPIVSMDEFSDDDSVLRRMIWAADLKMADVLHLLRVNIHHPCRGDVAAASGFMRAMVKFALAEADSTDQSKMMESICFVINVVSFRRSIHNSWENLISIRTLPESLSIGLLMHSLLSPDELLHFLAPLHETTLELPSDTANDIEEAINALIDCMDRHDQSCHRSAEGRVCLCCHVDPALYAELSRVTGALLLSLISTLEYTYMPRLESLLLMLKLSDLPFKDMLISVITTNDVMSSPVARNNFFIHVSEENLIAELKYIDYCARNKNTVSLIYESDLSTLRTTNLGVVEDFLFELKAYYLSAQSDRFLISTNIIVRDLDIWIFGENRVDEISLSASGLNLHEHLSRENFAALNHTVSFLLEQSFHRYITGVSWCNKSLRRPSPFCELKEILILKYMANSWKPS